MPLLNLNTSRPRLFPTVDVARSLQSIGSCFSAPCNNRKCVIYFPMAPFVNLSLYPELRGYEGGGRNDALKLAFDRIRGMCLTLSFHSFFISFLSYVSPRFSLRRGCGVAAYQRHRQFSWKSLFYRRTLFVSQSCSYLSTVNIVVLGPQDEFRAKV